MELTVNKFEIKPVEEADEPTVEIVVDADIKITMPKTFKLLLSCDSWTLDLNGVIAPTPKPVV